MFLGWYAYAFAAEPFVVSAMATYVPLLLEGLARENAVWAGDHRTPCHDVGDQPGLLPVPIAPRKCVVRLVNMWIDTASLPLYTFSVSVLIQTLLVISISGIADRGAHRKGLLVGFALLGSLATIVLGYVGKSQYYIAAVLAIVANASFGAVSVCGNAFLPQLVAHECSRLVRLRKTAVDRFHGAFLEHNASSGSGRKARLVTVEEKARISSRISGKGTAIGYCAAFFVQVVTILLLARHSSKESSNNKLRLVICFIGWWWLVGQALVFWYLPSDYLKEEIAENDNYEEVYDDSLGSSVRPPSISSASSDELDSVVSQDLSLLSQVAYGWISLVRTISEARKLRDITTFLVGWFLLSDAVTTINSTAVLFARTNLEMATPALALIGLITVVSAIAGSLVFGRRKRQSRSLVIIALIGALIPAYGILGFFQPWIGLKHAWEIYILAAWYGVALGALSAITRSLFALLIPQGHEVMFFALYAVTDKGSSIIGPTITGMITDRTHNIRYTFYFLLGMMCLAAFVFAHVDYERGQDEAAGEYSETTEDSLYLD